MCNVCGEWLPCTKEYFHKNKSNKTDGLHPCCKICNVILTTLNRYKNIEKRRQYDKEYNKEHWDKKQIQFKERYENKKEDWQDYYSDYLKRPSSKEKQKEYQKKYRHKKHKISKKEWELCKDYFNKKCCYCGLPIEEHYRKYAGKLQKIDFHKEHFDDDGVNDLSNCVPSCLNCNSEKHEKEFSVWYNENNPKYSKERYNKILRWIEEDYKKYIRKQQ